MIINHNQISKLAGYITDKYGIVTTKEQVDSLRKYASERMEYLNYHYFDDYFSWLLHKAGDLEWEQFVSLITINETYFYREPNHFKILDTVVFDELLRSVSDNRKIRIWSCGCSSGEEPYSIAICIKDKYGMDALKNKFEIIASDLDQTILKKAREAVYGKNSFRVKEHSYITSNFKLLDTGRYELNHDIRSAVKFFRYNVCEEMDTIPELASSVDIIIFRNVSIYFNSETLRKVHDRLQGRIGINGYMFVASCETMLHDLGKLRLLDMGGSFIFRKMLSGNAEQIKAEKKAFIRSIAAETDKRITQPVPKESYETLLTRIRSLMSDRKTDTNKPLEIKQEIVPNETSNKTIEEMRLLALERLQEDLFEESIAILKKLEKPDYNDLTIMAYSYMSLGKMEQAMDMVFRMKKIKEFNPVGYLFEGLIYKLSGASDKAIDALRKSIYLDLNYAVPHFHLAGLYQSIGKTNLAKNEYELTLRILEKEKRQLLGFSKSDVALDYIEYVSKKILNNTSLDMRERVK